MKGFKRKEREKGRCRLKSCLKGCKKHKKAVEENQRASMIKMRGKKRLIVLDAVHEPVGAGAKLVEVIEEDLIWIVNALLLMTRRALSPAC